MSAPVMYFSGNSGAGDFFGGAAGEAVAQTSPKAKTQHLALPLDFRMNPKVATEGAHCMIVAGGQSDLGLDSRTGQALPRGQTEPLRTWLTWLRTLSPLPTLDCVLIGSGRSASGPCVWAPLGLLPQESSGALLFLMVFLGFLYAPLSGRAKKALRVAGVGGLTLPCSQCYSGF